MTRDPYPVQLFRFLLLWHQSPQLVWIMKRPYCQLMQYSDFGEDIELAKLFWFLLIAVRIRFVRGLSIILTSSVFVPDLETVVKSGK